MNLSSNLNLLVFVIAFSVQIWSHHHAMSAKFLVEHGIDSISLNPDTMLKTTLAILATERAAEVSHVAGSMAQSETA